MERKEGQDNNSYSHHSRLITDTLSIVGIIAGVVLFVLLVWYAIDVLLLIFAGVLLAVFLRGISNWLGKRLRLPEGLALVVTLLVLVGLAGLVTWMLSPRITTQVSELQTKLPDALHMVRERIEKVVPMQQFIEMAPSPQSLLFGKAGMWRQVASFFSTTFSILTNLILFLFIGLYLAFDPDIYIKGIVRLVPVSKRSRARQVVNTLGSTLQWWLIGTLLDMVLVGILTGLGLWLLGIQLALTLGIFTALLTFVPFVGPILSVIPAALLAFVYSPMKALYVLILYAGIQLVESNLFQPIIQQKAVSLPPVFTITAQIVMSISFGMLGLILATPLAATTLVLVKMLYIEDILGDSFQTPGGARSKGAKGEH